MNTNLVTTVAATHPGAQLVKCPQLNDVIVTPFGPAIVDTIWGHDGLEADVIDEAGEVQMLKRTEDGWWSVIRHADAVEVRALAEAGI